MRRTWPPGRASLVHNSAGRLHFLWDAMGVMGDSRDKTSHVELRSGKWTSESPCRLGAADYLALADRFDAIAVVGIPTFSTHNENEARRFINLVDVLYERQGLPLAPFPAQPEPFLSPRVTETT